MTNRGLTRFGALGPAEVTLVEGVGTGAFDRTGSGELPEFGDEKRRVWADLIRFLLLGGPDAPRMHEKGLRLGRAWIVRALDREGCRLPCDIGLLDCLFDTTPVLRSAMIDTLALTGSTFQVRTPTGSTRAAICCSDLP